MRKSFKECGLEKLIFSKLLVYRTSCMTRAHHARISDTNFSSALIHYTRPQTSVYPLNKFLKRDNYEYTIEQFTS